MNLFAVSIISASAYFTAAFVLFRSLGIDYSHSRKAGTLAFAYLAAVLHAYSLSDMCDWAGQVNFSFMSVSSLAALLIVIVLLLAALFRPIDKLGLVIFPLAGLILLIRALAPEASHPLKTHAWQMNVHILTSMLAYSFLNIAALQAVLVAYQDWQLHTHHGSGRFARSLPPLQTMEKLLFQLMGVGFLLLTVSLVTGFIFIDDLFAQHLAHKTVLSIMAWLVFGTLMAGRSISGWRGKLAIQLTLAGFVSLMLAYFGSKIVLEWILHRS
jgi:ABC-type uncharacterized transport system permease subunit